MVLTILINWMVLNDIGSSSEPLYYQFLLLKRPYLGNYFPERVILDYLSLGLHVFENQTLEPGFGHFAQVVQIGQYFTVKDF